MAGVAGVAGGADGADGGVVISGGGGRCVW